jgi:hypothetical protein
MGPVAEGLVGGLAAAAQVDTVAAVHWDSVAVVEGDRADHPVGAVLHDFDA